MSEPLQTWSVDDLVLLPDGRTGKVTDIQGEMLTVDTHSGTVRLQTTGLESLGPWTEDDERAASEAKYAIVPLIVEDEE
ncbi:MAG: hypothetical protein ACREYF_14990 [Gammaproteobacteria bacterium]